MFLTTKFITHKKYGIVSQIFKFQCCYVGEIFSVIIFPVENLHFNSKLRTQNKLRPVISLFLLANNIFTKLSISFVYKVPSNSHVTFSTDSESTIHLGNHCYVGEKNGMMCDSTVTDHRFPYCRLYCMSTSNRTRFADLYLLKSTLF